MVSALEREDVSRQFVFAGSKRLSIKLLDRDKVLARVNVGVKR
jgi:hypothetical protein